MKRFIFLLLIFTGAAGAKTLSYEGASFSVDLPKEWKEVKDLYGIPVTLLGPSVSPKPRVVIQVIPTKLPHGEMKETDAKKFGDDYAQGRKRWVKEQEGEVLELLPGSFEKDRLSAGVSYKINNKRFLERTVYVNCPKKLFHLKLILNFENLDSLPEAQKILRSFECE